MDRRHRVHRRRPTAAPNSVPAYLQDFVPVPFGTRAPRSAYIDSIRALISAVLIEPLRTAGREFDLEVWTFI